MGADPETARRALPWGRSDGSVSRMRVWSLALVLCVAVACTDEGNDSADAGRADAAGAADAQAGSDATGGDVAASDGGSLDALAPDAEAADATGADATTDAGGADGGLPDSGPPYNCGAFSGDPGWTVQTGFRAVTIADQGDGLQQPVALVFAGGAFSNQLFVVNQGDNVLRSIDVRTGTVTLRVATTDWPVTPRLLTSITWDVDSVFDGNLYVADQGGDGDADSIIFRVEPTGTATVFARAPGPAMDDLYALVFASSSSYAPGLYVSGDTDGAGPDWARIDANGQINAFSEVAGVEGAVFDRGGAYGRRIIAARPAGGGYAGDGTITAIEGDGTAGRIFASSLGGIHAVVLSPGGAFGPYLYAASWSAGELLRIDPTGAVEVVASGLSLTNYDGNILAFSPDGQVLYVADRLAHRVVCIEPL